MCMSISFENKVFHLRSSGSSLVMQITSSGYLAHLYYGHNLPDGDYRFETLAPVLPQGSFFPNPPQEDELVSLATAMMEYPCYGTGDFRPTAIQAVGADGSPAVDLRYRSHKIYAGKPAIPGLPATYASEQDADTLEIEMQDHTGLTVTLIYTVFRDYPVITRSVRAENRGDQLITLDKIYSSSTDFPTNNYDLLHLWGSWAMERTPERTPLTHGGQRISSLRGSSGHIHNPFAALVEKDASEEMGEVFGFSLVYSGSFAIETEVDSLGQTRVLCGINPDGFGWRLNPGERFDTPEPVMVYSDTGIGGMSRTYHKLYSRHLIRGPWRDRDRPIIINNWEATYFEFNEEKLLQIARAAAPLGIEMLVMDDGWFGHRDDDHSSLGDWYVDQNKLPLGLGHLSDELHKLGMQMGIWFEPEMISPVSDLYRAHPDWALQLPGRPNSPARWQYVLDMSRQDVQDYLFDSISAILSSAKIEYVKWDFNRNLTEVGSALLPPEQQKEVGHRYMLGLYALLERLLTAFPDLLLEGCSGGGGRFDPGMLYYSPQIWTSDDTDPIERLTIQYGTSIAYPPSSMSAHVSASPNHQTGRVTSLNTRGVVAMGGSFGYELDISKLSDAEKAEIADQIRQYHEYAPIIRDGSYYRLMNTHEAGAWEIVSADGKNVLVGCVSVLVRVVNIRILKLRGLDENARYRDPASGLVYTGGALMHSGLNLSLLNLRDREAVMIKLERID